MSLCEGALLAGATSRGQLLLCGYSKPVGVVRVEARSTRSKELPHGLLACPASRACFESKRSACMPSEQGAR